MRYVKERESVKVSRPPLRAIIASLLGIVTWFVLIALYSSLWSTGLTTFQETIVAVFSIFATGLLIETAWLSFHSQKEQVKERQDGFSER